MMKKNLQSVTANLGDLAATMPTQMPLAVVRRPVPLPGRAAGAILLSDAEVAAPRT